MQPENFNLMLIYCAVVLALLGIGIGGLIWTRRSKGLTCPRCGARDVGEFTYAVEKDGKRTRIQIMEMLGLRGGIAALAGSLVLVGITGFLSAEAGSIYLMIMIAPILGLAYAAMASITIAIRKRNLPRMRQYQCIKCDLEWEAGHEPVFLPENETPPSPKEKP